jgi:hypothetical protein
MNTFQKFIGHARTVHRHRAMVRRLCFKCGLYWQGMTHDMSKYSPVEFWNGVKYYTGTASPHIGERKEKGHSDAWVHHHNRNKHHGEYWWDINPDGKSCPIPMPTKYLKEMICDRVAASMIYLGDKYHNAAPLEYYRSHKDENQFNPMTREHLEMCLESIKELGFEEAMKGTRAL